jgi:predicted homoserine dehydrogenase-like protein
MLFAKESSSLMGIAKGCRLRADIDKDIYILSNVELTLDSIALKLRQQKNDYFQH